MDIGALLSDYGQVEGDTTAVKLETDRAESQSQQKPKHCEESSGTSVLDQEQSPLDDANLCSTSPICAAPLCRQFWKAGPYNDDLTPKSTTKLGSNYLHIHPKFLHSNATSHKWAFGAIAELIDNAVDEIQKNAKFVYIDKTINPRNGCTALLIQDDGSGMDPEAMRHCLSFGFSDKKSQFAIGKYGNGFKTSTMRLGADAIIFSRHITNTTITQSIGLLSYTFLTREGYDRIVVPMVHYEYNLVTETFDPLHAPNNESPNSNLSVILKWSPYSTEEELLDQFGNIGYNGTKIIVYNLWLDDDGNMELDFESDPEDIRITWDGNGNAKRKAATDQHIANRLRYSLRAYLSILYLKLPSTFAIVLRGKVILYHNIATDLKHQEFILYKPQSDGCAEGSVVTTIGFDKNAPDVNVHGFNIYHKNRLILPFQQVVVIGASRGRGVIGVLEANFIEPTHNKQDFEKTSLFQKLMTRLKEMTLEYWQHHCGRIGYQQGYEWYLANKKARPTSVTPGSSNCVHQHVESQPSFRKGSSDGGPAKQAPVIATINSKAAFYSSSSIFKPVELKQSFPPGFKEGSNLKRKSGDEDAQMGTRVTDMGKNGGVIDENKKLKTRCLEFEKAEEELKHKVERLKMELRDAKSEYAWLLNELQALEITKREN
ncbi:protein MICRORCHIDIA 6-like [Bidens hawaiensis]|uniref:protein MICRORCHIDIA 6-like n=1 Tax=Bidens hawaiensis TaxID=980011 RepID=UPI00404A9D86